MPFLGAAARPARCWRGPPVELRLPGSNCRSAALPGSVCGLGAGLLTQRQSVGVAAGRSGNELPRGGKPLPHDASPVAASITFSGRSEL